MIRYYLLFICSVFFLASCNQKQMKISRAGASIQTEMTDFSPAYIEKTAQGEAKLNDNNLIGNTHWVISAERDLTLQQIAPFLQQLTDKKYSKEGMHPDDKDIYFVYSDTVNKQNAYVKMPFENISLEPLPEYEMLLEAAVFYGINSDVDFKNSLKDRLVFANALNIDLKLVYMEINPTITVEQFVALLIAIGEENKDKMVEYPSVAIY